jgi:hypothetical protein
VTGLESLHAVSEKAICEAKRVKLSCNGDPRKFQGLRMCVCLTEKATGRVVPVQEKGHVGGDVQVFMSWVSDEEL